MSLKKHYNVKKGTYGKLRGQGSVWWKVVSRFGEWNWERKQESDNWYDPILEDEMRIARNVVEATYVVREKVKVHRRTPIDKLFVSGGSATEKAVQKLEDVIKTETNAKNVEFVGKELPGMSLVVEPNRAKLGPAFKGMSPKIMDALKSSDAVTMRQTLESENKYDLVVEEQTFTILPEMVSFGTSLPPGIVGADFDGGSVYFNPTLSNELLAEGLANELGREIQMARKELGFVPTQQATVKLGMKPETAKLLEPFVGSVSKRTHSTIEFIETPTGPNTFEWDLGGEEVVASISTE